MKALTWQTVVDFLKGESVSMAFRYISGAFIPLLFFLAQGDQATGLTLMLGTLLVSGADKREPVRRKVKTLALTILLSSTLSAVVMLAAHQYVLLFPLIFLFIFLLGYVAPFGTRYASMAFMGNLAIIIALSTYRSYTTPAAIIHHLLLLLAGGIWYAAYALTLSALSARRQLRKTIATCMERTTAYLEQRVRLFDEREDLGEGLLALSDRQTDVTYAHTDVRDFLFQWIRPLQQEGSWERKMLMIFVELLEIQETALGTPIDYERWRGWLTTFPELDVVPRFSRMMVAELEGYYRFFNSRKKTVPSEEARLERQAEEARQVLDQFQRTIGNDPERRMAYLRARRILTYQEIQFKKLQSLRRILENRAQQTETKMDDRMHYRFANTPEMTWEAIRNNFTIRSSYFRYALRTSITAVAGYLFGMALGFQNPYWVLLTVLVILKPGYAVSRQRFTHRLIGTILGALIAYGLYLLHPSQTASIAIFGTAFFIAFCFVTEYYAVASVFVTIYVVFLYSFLHREIPGAVLFRVVDTSVGAALCWVAMHYLWPSWEYQSFPYYLRVSLESNLSLLRKITRLVGEGAWQQTSYRLSRKRAYLDLANVVSSFQRLKNEPRRKQEDLAPYGSLILLHSAVMSVIASIGVYLSRHPQLLQVPGLYGQLREAQRQLEQTLGLVYKRLDQPVPLTPAEPEHALPAPSPQGADTSDEAFLFEEIAHLNGLIVRLQEQINRTRGVRLARRSEVLVP
ncbi:Uncharacterized membrane protein YccC [Catalinimonas alkaloidigena]|uniref:Uncharacterized membrane protein YccC n=1 Tax=Catalinimonas alkaloidigena TaxID=1075417 RepID=A0A1G9RP04_9BACT|nr:FUSC family membrane protein [Catalinimonas alkaloidigena]SDM25006.1 Uncharacterized membrane protein YccC [Catalinimonas alkaloidigena]